MSTLSSIASAVTSWISSAKTTLGNLFGRNVTTTPTTSNAKGPSARSSNTRTKQPTEKTPLMSRSSQTGVATINNQCKEASEAIENLLNVHVQSNDTGLNAAKKAIENKLGQINYNKIDFNRMHSTVGSDATGYEPKNLLESLESLRDMVESDGTREIHPYQISGDPFSAKIAAAIQSLLRKP